MPRADPLSINNEFRERPVLTREIRSDRIILFKLHEIGTTFVYAVNARLHDQYRVLATNILTLDDQWFDNDIHIGLIELRQANKRISKSRTYHWNTCIPGKRVIDLNPTIHEIKAVGPRFHEVDGRIYEEPVIHMIDIP